MAIESCKKVALPPLPKGEGWGEGFEMPVQSWCSLLLASSLREEGQAKKTFAEIL